ncbi:hypothetical protein GGR58DRAFT_495640 [Xylaria digitata]|nr:hypothetical protein GGR58DRAFT_495640 [Xylaria digitata]
MTSGEIAKKYLRIKEPGRAMWAYKCYSRWFERTSDMRERIPKTNIPGLGYEDTIPWIVEAPPNSVGVLEALFKPIQRGTSPGVDRRAPGTTILPRYGSLLRSTLIL